MNAIPDTLLGESGARQGHYLKSFVQRISYLVVSVFVLTACNRSTPQDSSSSGESSGPQPPTITATPNPVPAGPGQGTAMINWDTGDGSSGEVYLFVEGHGEQLFSSGSQGSNEAPWISTGGIYEFRLYQATNRAKPLASVKVTRNTN